jgi:hypothetical protein
MTQIFSVTAADRLKSIADEILLGNPPRTSLKAIWPEEALADDHEVARFLTEELAAHGDNAGKVEAAPAYCFNPMDRHANKLMHIQGDSHRLFALHHLRPTALTWRETFSKADFEEMQAHKAEEERRATLWFQALADATQFTAKLWEAAHEYSKKNATVFSEEQRRDLAHLYKKQSFGKIDPTIGNVALYCGIMGVSLYDIAALLHHDRPATS